MKEQIKKLMKEHLLNESEVITAIEFIAELIDLELQHDLKEFPNASVSHKEHSRAYYIVRDLEEFFNDHYKNNL